MPANGDFPGGGAGDQAGRLEAVGLGALEERLYQALLVGPQATVSELAASAGISPTRARRALAALERAGMLNRQPGPPDRYVPAPPDIAVGALISRRRHDLEQARLYADRLLIDFHQGARYEQAAQLVEIITRPEVIRRRVVQLIRGAQEEVLMLDKPPYFGPLDNPDEFDALARGVRWQAVYSPESLDVPGQVARLRQLRRAGEQARVVAGVPIKLVIADRRLALLPLIPDQSTVDGAAIMVYSSSLLATLTMLFEALWMRGLSLDLALTPQHAATSPNGGADGEILPLLAAGMKDEAIARQLGVSLRTVRRWVGRLMTQYGVATRFQLGLAIARQVGPWETGR